MDTRITSDLDKKRVIYEGIMSDISIEGNLESGDRGELIFTFLNNIPVEVKTYEQDGKYPLGLVKVLIKGDLEITEFLEAMKLYLETK